MRIARRLSAKFELARHGDGANLASMEGLRGLAVILVFGVHFCTLVRPWAPSGAVQVGLDAVQRIGHAGVDLFFVLSGYLIYGALIGRPRAFMPYMKRRIERIYPAFLAVFLIYLVLSWLMPSQGKLPWQGWELALYIVSNLLLLPGIFPIEPLITVAWSLSYEMFYYLTLPAVIVGLGLRDWTPARRVILFSIIGLAITVYCAIWAGHVRLIMFIAGILLFEALAKPSKRIAPAALVLAALAIGVAADLLRPNGSLGYATRTFAWFVSFGLLCHLCFAQPAGVTARLFSWSPLRWLGNMSFSYYLIHGLTLKALFMVMGKVWVPSALSLAGLLALAAVAFALSLMGSAALFLAIERPFSLDVGRH